MTRVPPPHLLPKSSSRNNHAMPLHLAVHPPNVLVQHRPQVVQDLQRPLRVTDDRQPRPRRAIPCCAMERRSSTQKRTYVRNVRFLIHLSLPLTHAYPQMRKGQNTGYKNYDPSHPCRKCWDRFSKPFTSILASSPWGGQGSGAMSQSERGRTFQRPLPAFKPPQVQPPRLQVPPPQAMPGSYPPLSPPGMPSPTLRVASCGAVPPPGATVVMPGDPRIGGRLCWRCGGRGVTPFLIFDEITCDTCMGIGRLMN